MKVKRYIAVLLVLMLSMGLSGCVTPDRNTIVPDVVGLHIEEAQELVNERKLVDIFIKGTPAEAPEFEYIVYSQDPQAGMRVRKGISVLMTHYDKILNPYIWIRGLLTLKPKPSKQQAFNLGFNLINPYAGLPTGWISGDGKVIYTTKIVRDNETGAVAYSTCDEPDCHKHNPYSELELVRRMKKETSLPVGNTLCGDIGCGTSGTATSKAEYQRQWVEVANQMDFIMVCVYPYKEPQYLGGRTPLEEMEYRHQFFVENITVPIIIIIQAHQQSKYHLIKPNPYEQVKFWVDRGYGYIVYPWDDGGSPIGGVADMQDEWRKANKYGIPCIQCGDKEEVR